jgi:beta-lactamase regulating signal transducer with metallopeptidase domain
MFTIEKILSQEIVQKLGWSLIHLIWQAAAVAVLTAVLLRILRRFSANLRYAVACLALGLMVLLPVVTMQYISGSTQPPAKMEIVQEPAVLSIQPAGEIPTVETITYTEEKPVTTQPAKINYFSHWKQTITGFLESSLPNIVTLWLLGVFGFSIWHLGGWTQLQRLRKKMVKPVDAFLKNQLRRLSEKLHVKQAVELLESAVVQVPTVVGWVRPVILLPASALTGLSNEQLEAILAHELAHIKRFDYLVNLMQTMVEILGFYHPAVWWISHRIRIERENCCDDLAVAVCGDRISYARALTSLEEIRSRSDLAVAATGGHLFSRICRLIGKEPSEKSSFSWIPAVIVILLLIALTIPATLTLATKTNFQSSEPNIAGQKADSPAAEKETLGKIVELTVNVTGSTQYVDLDTGNLLFYPKDLSGDIATTQAWDKQNSIDLLFTRTTYGSSQVVYLMGRDIAIAPVSEAKWSCTEKELMLEAKKAEWEQRSYIAQPNVDSILPNSPGTGPCPTFVFKTQEGNAGILQVLRIIKSGQYEYQAKMRYWLLKNPSIKIDDEEIIWGPAMDGIVCAVKPVKKSFTNGENFEFDITYKNISDHPITVCTYPDYFYTWTQLMIIDSAGMKIAQERHADGASRPISDSDLVTLQPNQTTFVRAQIESSFINSKNWPTPGKYAVKATINMINKMRNYIGYEEFCSKNNIKPWTGSYEIIRSGTSTFLITSMPEIQWGQEAEGLQVGIRQADLNDVSIKVPVFLRNNRSDDKKYFDSMNFEIIVKNKTYLSYQWPTLNGRQLTIYPGQTKGPIWIDLGDYIDESNREKSYQAERPLKQLPNGKYNLRAVYVGRNGNPRISSNDINFTISDDSNWGEAVEGVQIHLLNTKQNFGRSDWPHTTLQLTLEARNNGKRYLALPENGLSWQIEVDGLWYEWVDPQRFNTVQSDKEIITSGGRLLDFNPGDSHSELNMNIGSNWRQIPDGKQDEFGRRRYSGSGWVINSDEYGRELIFNSGQHRIRVAITCPPSRRMAIIDSPVRLVSNLVEIEIFSPEGTTAEQTKTEQGWGQAVDGLSVRLMNPIEVVSAGTGFNVAVELQNTSSNTILWECISEITWNFISPESLLGCPKFHVKIGQGTRPAQQKEVRDKFGISPGDDLYRPQAPATNYFCFEPGGKLQLIRDLNWNPESPGTYRMECEVSRYSPTANEELGAASRMTCPPLILTVNNKKTTVKIETSKSAAQINLEKPAVEDKVEKAWGEAVEGVRCHVQAEKSSWTQGSIPKLFADIQNQGQRNLRIAIENESWEVEIDGKWYKTNFLFTGDRRYLPLQAGQQQQNLVVPIIAFDNIGQALGNLESGKHILRVARLLNSRSYGEEILRIVSNPIEIEILPEEENTSELDKTIDPNSMKIHYEYAGLESIVLSGNTLEHIWHTLKPDLVALRQDMSSYDRHEFKKRLTESEIALFELWLLDNNVFALPTKIPDRGESTYGGAFVTSFRVEYNKRVYSTGWTGDSILPVLVNNTVQTLKDLCNRIQSKADAQIGAEKAAIQTKAEQAWGQEVDGIQFQLKPEQDVWKQGQSLKFLLDIRNIGQKTVRIYTANHKFLLEWDGLLYYQSSDVNGSWTDLKPGGSLKNIAVVVDQPPSSYTPPWMTFWRSREFELIKLTPGKHTVRIAQDPGSSSLSPTLFSNPVEIEILPAEEKTAENTTGTANSKPLIHLYSSSPEQNAKMIEELFNIPNQPNAQTRLETSILAVSEETLKEVGNKLNLTFDSNTILDDRQVESLLKAARSSQEAKIIIEPNVIVVGIKSAEIFTGRTIPFITGYNEPNETAQQNAQPIYEQRKIGILIKCSPGAISNQNFNMTVQVQITQLTGSSEQIFNDKYKAVVPLISDFVTTRNAILSAGQTFFIDCGMITLYDTNLTDSPGKQKRVLLLVKPTILSQEQNQKSVPDSNTSVNKVATADMKMPSATQDKMVQLVYDVSDLIAADDVNELINRITNTIEPNSWSDKNLSWDDNNRQGKGSLFVYPTKQPQKLAVFNTPEVQRKILSFFDSYRNSQEFKLKITQISIELRYLYAGEEFFNEIKESMDIEFNMETFLDDKQVESILRAFQKNNDTKSLIVPKVTVLNNKTAQWSLEQNFSPFTSPNEILQPPLSMTNNVLCKITPHVIADNKNVFIDLIQDKINNPSTEIITTKNKEIPYGKTLVLPLALSNPEQNGQTTSPQEKKKLIMFVKPTTIIIPQEQDPKSGPDSKTSANFGALNKTLKTMAEDQTQPKILIETQVIRVRDNFLTDIGLDANSLKESSVWSRYRISDSNGYKRFILDQLSANLLLKTERVNKSISALAPSVIIENGKPVYISMIGDEIYWTKSKTELENLKAGTFINLIPTVEEGNKIRLALDMKINECTYFSRTNSKVLTKNETVFAESSDDIFPESNSLMIIGSRVTVSAEIESKVPILGHLPLFNRYFSNRSYIKEYYTPLILIKPTLRKDYNYIKDNNYIKPDVNNAPLIKQLAEKMRS